MTRNIAHFAFGLLLAVQSSAAPATGLCEAPPKRRYPSLARAIGITVDAEWVATHVAAIHESFLPGCRVYEACLSVWGNPIDFCRLRLTVSLREACESRFDMAEDFRGWQQCRAVADVYSIGQRAPGQLAWPALQKLAAENAGPGGARSPEVIVEPAMPEPGVGFTLVVKAFQPGTEVPVYGRISIDGVPYGPTFEPIEYALHFIRETDELGRAELRMPDIVVEARPDPESGAPSFTPVAASFSTPIPTNDLAFDPRPDLWTVGVNEVRVTATDTRTGEQVRGHVLRPGSVLGSVDRPVAIELRAGEDGLCGEPHWFRPDAANRPDTRLPIVRCR